MNSLNHLFNFKRAGILGLCSTLLVGIPLISQRASAQVQQRVITSPVCPGLYYQEPWRSILDSPMGCPSNDTNLYGQTPENSSPVNPITPPLPEETSPAVATIVPKKGNANIQLSNTTNTVVTYEVIGHTDQRQLNGGQSVDLTNIPLPTTITVIRPDNGFLRVIPVSSKSDSLKVTLQEDPNFDDTQGVIRIQENGNVFLN